MCVRGICLHVYIQISNNAYLCTCICLPIFHSTSENPILVTTPCWIGSTLIFCNWTRVEQVCFPGTTYRCRCTRVSDNVVVIDITTNENKFMFSGLDPNTTYRVEIFLNGTNSSNSSTMTTFG